MYPGSPYGGTPDPYQGHPTPQGHVPAPGGKGRGRGILLPALLVIGSLGGVGLVMAGLLTYFAPAAEEEVYGPPAPEAVAQVQPQPVPGQEQGQPGQPQPVSPDQQPAQVQEQEQNPAALPEQVGPGGLDVPLTAAAPTAPPPLPVVMPPEPLKSTGVSPRKIAISKIGVLTTLMPLGVDAKQAIQTPPLSKPGLAGWYRYGPVPGQQGPSVILGHVNANGRAAVFSRLRELRRGDKIKVSRSDGKIAEFTVDGVEQVSKKAFPSKRVYGNTGEATLRLITCGGVYNPKTRHYTDNIIVYATLSATRRA
ncbi:hypothetical protein GCM10010156_71020 [Planobispora rosea]|uniref:Class F sortase n=1 Tax=Planobispora rosea TaxID=35762 RepID=A0A8J3WEY7_PLARO|nr:class F sortase [Planobispora rosea]GGT02869.1 hypothetical protein GCM10010156_71020 [Planobispora rosea]GIH86840.1 hypothetical protein Pro02_52480 [Planobispora rosea]